MQIVIPMAGAGSRFVRAGYTTLKPLIEVDGRPMLEHIVANFPGERDFLFICTNDQLANPALRALIQRLAPEGRLVGVAPHKLGPVHTALEAASHIADDQPVLLNHCDFGWDWDYTHFKQWLAEHEPAGCITAYRGFHPHSLGPNLYAYMREHDGRLLEIKEKGCFTNDRMYEFASAGGYYFSSGALLKQTFRAAVERGLRTNGEYYASTPYNLLVEAGLPVLIYELRHFLQWGTPEDLQEYQAWSDYFARWADWRPSLPPVDGALLLPMAGDGARFAREGYAQPKPLVPVAGRPMVQRSVESLPPARQWLALCRAEHLAGPALAEALCADGRPVQILPVAERTAGQASTCLLARDHLAPDAPLLIAPCDTALVYDEAAYAALIADPDVDCVIWTFRNHPHANRKPRQYGWLQAAAGGQVTGVVCKQPISDAPRNDPGIIGAFWFRQARYFLEAADQLIAEDRRINGEFYVDMAIQVLLEQGRRARLFDVRHYLCFGTPDDVRTFDYWEHYFRSAAAHRYGLEAQHA